MTGAGPSGLLSGIVAAQNPDGGWSYARGSSWTEPTAYALLALTEENASPEAWRRGVAWLEKNQRPDGGWPPENRVHQSTWVTALVLLALADHGQAAFHRKAIDWLVHQTGRESGWTYRLRRWLSGQPADLNLDVTGWPWYPDTAAWVTPTALTVVAGAKIYRRFPLPALRERLEMGRRYLLSRQCGDGGWNHGYSRGFGYDVGSYPETTGQALLALHGVRDGGVEKGLARAEAQLRDCRSSQALDWLRLGLSAHGRPVSEIPQLAVRSIPDMALSLLADSAARGKNLFLEQVT